MSNERIKDITIVGGGDAGLMSGLILDELVDDISITVIDDFNESPPEIGKSTTNYIINTLHNVLGIDRKRFFSHVRPIWKGSVYFKDWCGQESFHVPFDDQVLQPEKFGSDVFEELYFRYKQRKFRTVGVEIAEQRLSPIEVSNGSVKSYPHVAYHLGVNKLNLFLRDLCEERGIRLINDRIDEVELSGNMIRKISSSIEEYHSDLYIDASGFERVLFENLKGDFKEFDIPLDSALVTKEHINLSEVVPATVVTSGNCGWFWQIDTFDWRDRGYVYSSDHASRVEALREFNEVTEPELSRENTRHFEFESGYHQNAWVMNCISIGNALGFVEPLQSTALTTNAILTEKLGMLIADHNRVNHRGVRDIYNKYVQSMWENIYDFISIHYRYSSGNTEFWDDVQEVNREDRLKQYYDNYQNNGFCSYKDFNQWQFTENTHFYRIFNQWHFYRVLRSLGVRSDFYEDLEISVRDSIRADIDKQEHMFQEDVGNNLSHEEFYTDLVK